MTWYAKALTTRCSDEPPFNCVPRSCALVHVLMRASIVIIDTNVYRPKFLARV